MDTKVTCMLTTHDNPFDPFEKFDEWFAYDSHHGYNTSSFLERVVQLDIGKRPTTQATDEEWNKGMREIVALLPETYKILKKEVEVDPLDEFMS